eukprot:gene8780-13986_t
MQTGLTDLRGRLDKAESQNDELRRWVQDLRRDAAREAEAGGSGFGSRGPPSPPPDPTLQPTGGPPRASRGPGPGGTSPKACVSYPEQHKTDTQRKKGCEGAPTWVAVWAWLGIGQDPRARKPRATEVGPPRVEATPTAAARKPEAQGNTHAATAGGSSNAVAMAASVAGEAGDAPEATAPAATLVGCLGRICARAGTAAEGKGRGATRKKPRDGPGSGDPQAMDAPERGARTAGGGGR